MSPFRFLITVAAGLSFVCGAFAQSPSPAGSTPAAASDQGSSHVSLLTEILDLPAALALQFVEKFGQAKPNEHAAVLAELVKQYAQYATPGAPAQPRSISVPAVAVRNGQRAVVEMVQEYRYPTEFARGEGMAIPVAFETRNIGTSVELMPQRAADGKTWEVETVFQFVHLAETKIYGAGLYAVEQPIFASRKIAATVKLQPGVPQFVGIVGPDARVDKDSKEPVRLVILTAAVPDPAP